MFLAVPITAAVQILCDNIPSLKPVAVLLGSGKQYRKQIELEEKRRRERYAKDRLKRRTDRASHKPAPKQKQQDSEEKSVENRGSVSPSSEPSRG
jgi:hypothetical protein